MQNRHENLKHEQWFALDTETTMKKLNIDNEVEKWITRSFIRS